MNTEELRLAIREAKKLGKMERLEHLNYIASDLANDFTYNMSVLEDEIQEALDNTGERIKNQLGYHSIEDVTQDINVTPSFQY